MNIAFLHVKSHQGNITPLGLTFGLVVACCVFDTIRLKDTLISNKTRKNQLISLIFDMETINKVKQHLRLSHLGVTQDSLIISISGRKELIPLLDHFYQILRGFIPF